MLNSVEILFQNFLAYLPEQTIGTDKRSETKQHCISHYFSLTKIYLLLFFGFFKKKPKFFFYIFNSINISCLKSNVHKVIQNIDIFDLKLIFSIVLSFFLKLKVWNISKLFWLFLIIRLPVRVALSDMFLDWFQNAE